MLQCYLSIAASVIFLLAIALIYAYPSIDSTAFYTNTLQCELRRFPGLKFKSACYNSVWDWLFPTLFALLFTSIFFLFILCLCNLYSRCTSRVTLVNRRSWLLQNETTPLINRVYNDTHIYSYGTVQFQSSDEFFTNRPPPPPYFTVNISEPPPPYSPSSNASSQQQQQ